jgi:hypothetical protein
MITFEQAKQLQYGQEIQHVTLKNADGTPMKFRVSGSVKTWKREPYRVRIPIKRGLCETGYLTNGSWESGRNWNLTLNDVTMESCRGMEYVKVTPYGYTPKL